MGREGGGGTKSVYLHARPADRPAGWQVYKEGKGKAKPGR